MRHGQVTVADPVAWLAQTQTDLPVMFFSATALEQRHQIFRAGFPGAGWWTWDSLAVSAL